MNTQLFAIGLWLFAGSSAYAAEAINEKNWMNHPEIVELPSDSIPELPSLAEPVQETKVDTKRNSAFPISMSVHMLGPFRMEIQETALEFPPSRKVSLLQYLVVNHTQSPPRDVLMDMSLA